MPRKCWRSWAFLWAQLVAIATLWLFSSEVGVSMGFKSNISENRVPSFGERERERLQDSSREGSNISGQK